MHLYIFGFLPDSDKDNSLKYQLKIDTFFNEKIVKLLGHKSLNAMAEEDWTLTIDQVSQLSDVIRQPLPNDLELVIGVVA